MTERPILFSAPMVQAILAGRKTQTRRVVKLHGHDGLQPDHAVWRFCEFHDNPRRAVWQNSEDMQRVITEVCPYGQARDRLWVRETWASAYRDGCWGTAFAADLAFIQGKRAHPKGPHFHAKELGEHVRWKPSIHMPRWASRITLEITEVRVQRLNDISERDAAAEGIEGPYSFDRNLCPGPLASLKFYHLWESINGEGSWDANPFCWCISFRRIHG